MILEATRPESPVREGLPRPWLKFYDPEVPAHLDYPRIPIYRLLDDSAVRAPGRPCTNFFGKTLTYGEIKDLSDRCAAGLRRLGVRRGDRVALLLPSSPQFVIAYYGLLKAGAIGVLLNPLLTEHELAVHLNHAEPGVLVTIPMLIGKVAALVERAPIRHVVSSPLADYLPFPAALAQGFRERKASRAAGKLTTVAWRDLLAGPLPADFGPEPVDPGDLAVLLYSGGTTGSSKAVALSHFNCVANALQAGTWGHLLDSPEEGGRMLVVLPLFHGFGMSVTMNVPVAAANEMIILPRFNPTDVVKTIQKYRPRFMLGVPTMFAALSRVPGIERYNLRSIEGIFVGAAPLTLALKESFEARSGASIIEGYGLTETVTGIMANPLRGTQKLGSIGIPLPDVDARIVSIEDGRDLPSGELGEIVVRSPSMMLGYYKKPEETAKTVVDGWLYTGDIGRMDEDGYFYITDRKKELIIVGGFNVYPREVDELIAAHPKVQEGVCAGVPDQYHGERVKVFVVLKAGEAATEEEFMTYFRERLVWYKVPVAVAFRSELPKNAIGKVLRRVLREEQSAG